MNLPNRLTLLRIILIPFYTLLLCLPSPANVTFLHTTIAVNYLIATIIFILASLTDYLDGQIARKNNLVTNFGKFADPLADKLLVLTAFIFLAVDRIIPVWGLAIIIWRELAVTGLRLLLADQGEVVAAALPGKIKTFSQMIAVIFLNLNNVGFAAINIPFGQIMFYISLFFAVYSGVDYFYKNSSVFKNSI